MGRSQVSDPNGFLEYVQGGYGWIVGIMMALLGAAWYLSGLTVAEDGFQSLPGSIRVAVIACGAGMFFALWTFLAIGGSRNTPTANANGYSNVKIPLFLLILAFLIEVVSLATYFL